MWYVHVLGQDIQDGVYRAPNVPGAETSDNHGTQTSLGTQGGYEGGRGRAQCTEAEDGSDRMSVLSVSLEPREGLA